jgi:hypothetical protein
VIQITSDLFAGCNDRINVKILKSGSRGVTGLVGCDTRHSLRRTSMAELIGKNERMRDIMNINETIQADIVMAMKTDYLPQDAGREKIRKLVHGAVARLQKNAGGIKPGPNDMDTAIQLVQQWIRAAGLQIDRTLVTEIVKAELAK